MNIKYYRKFFSITRWLQRNEIMTLTLVAVLIYLILIFENLTVFPAYFFCDEAIVGVEAHSILTTGADRFGKLFPIFFQGLGQYQQSLAIYLQVPFIAIFGLNEFAVRFANACIGLLGIIAVYALIRYVYKMAEAAMLTFAVFALSSLWFLHSRTGFEVVMAVAFFLGFGLFYILAFSRHILFVIPAAVCGAATFYAYTPGRGWILIALPLLFLVNISEHLQKWKVTLLGMVIFALLLSPYAYFQWKYPHLALSRLSALNFANFRDQSVWQQAKFLLQGYKAALNPLSWYTTQGTLRITEGGERHFMHRFPALFAGTLPFALLGFIRILRYIKKIENRTLLALLAASPFAASLIRFNTVRGMPVGMLMLVFSLVGLGWVFAWLRRWPQSQRVIQTILVFSIIVYAFWFRDYVYNVLPRLYHDYGFYGLQMGAPQLFRWIRGQHHRYDSIMISHDLFNAGEIFIPFYLQGKAAAKTSIIDPAILCKTLDTISERRVYAVPVIFFPKMQAAGCPLKRVVLYVIPDLKGRPLIEILQLHQEPEFTEWFQEHAQERKTLIASRVDHKGDLLRVQHPRFDLGNVRAIFDGNPQTFARSAEINPAHITISLPNTSLQRIVVTISHTGQAAVSVKTHSQQGITDWGRKQFREATAHFTALTFEQSQMLGDVTKIEISALLTNADQYGFVHIAEIDWE
jgi:4-amino-4-deoxy-L-arabinose transferase-like glycosyltransferase